MPNARIARIVTLTLVLLAAVARPSYAQLDLSNLRQLVPLSTDATSRACLAVTAPRTCAAVPSEQKQEPLKARKKTAIKGGGGLEVFASLFAPEEAGDVNPPAPGATTALSSNRFSTAFATGFAAPGTTVYREVGTQLNEGELQRIIGILEENDARMHLIREIGLKLRREMRSGTVFKTSSFGARPAPRVPALGAMAGTSVAWYVEGSWMPLPEPEDATRDAMNDGADRVLVGIRDGLLRSNTTSFATLTKTTNGGYHGGIKIGGGVEIGFNSRFAGFNPGLTGGVTYVVPVGSERVQHFVLDYGFTASGVTFNQIDDATFRVTRGKSFGVEAGLTLMRPIGRCSLNISVLLSALQSKYRIGLTTNPSTTSSQPAAVLFSTPPGTRTILISTAPGLPSSLSIAVTDHPFLRIDGWRVGPVLRVGVGF